MRQEKDVLSSVVCFFLPSFFFGIFKCGSIRSGPRKDSAQKKEHTMYVLVLLPFRRSVLCGSRIFPFTAVMCERDRTDKAFRRTLTPSSSLLVSCYCLCGQTQSFWVDRKYRLDVNRSSFVKMAK